MSVFAKYLKVSNEIFNELFDQTEQNIYHYTSPLGLQSIIENGTLRFTDRFYLNDANEGYYVLNLLIENKEQIFSDDSRLACCKETIVSACKKYIDSMEKYEFKIYQISFSLNDDSLCMWNYYTKGDTIQGYNIHFNSQKLCQSLEIPEYPIHGKPHILCGKVIYDKKEQIRILREYLEKIYSAIEDDHGNNHASIHFTNRIESIIERITLIGTFFKKECFEIEKEYRIAIDLFFDQDVIKEFSDMKDEDGEKYKLLQNERKFDYRHGMFIPHIDIKFDTKTIEGISLSPTLDFEITRKNLMLFLEDKGIGTIDIKKSDIPVRF